MDLVDFERRVPPVGADALLRLVNAIHINKDRLRFEERRGFAGRLWDSVAGTSRKRDLFAKQDAFASLATLVDVVEQVRDELRIGAVAQRLTVGRLEQIDSELTALWTASDRASGDIEVIELRLRALSSEVNAIQGRLSAVEFQGWIDQVIARWSAGKTYRGLPLLAQLELVTREVFLGELSIEALAEGKTEALVEYFVNRTITHLRKDLGLPLALRMDEHLDEVARFDGEEREALASILNPRRHFLANQSVSWTTFCVGTALEFGDLSSDVRPSSIGRVALELAERNFASIRRIPPLGELVDGMATSVTQSIGLQLPRIVEAGRGVG